jgi:hypothetical protein
MAEWATCIEPATCGCTGRSRSKPSRLNRQSILGGADWPIVFVQNAAIHALRDEVSEALDDLDRGYAAGWRDGRTLAIDPLLASVRSQPRFQQLISRIESDVAVMRARADYSGLR